MLDWNVSSMVLFDFYALQHLLVLFMIVLPGSLFLGLSGVWISLCLLGLLYLDVLISYLGGFTLRSVFVGFMHSMSTWAFPPFIPAIAA